jgi:hypothetical protein
MPKVIEYLNSKQALPAQKGKISGNPAVKFCLVKGDVKTLYGIGLVFQVAGYACGYKYLGQLIWNRYSSANPGPSPNNLCKGFFSFSWFYISLVDSFHKHRKVISCRMGGR